MSAFAGKLVSLNTTPQKIVESADFDRRVHWRNPTTIVGLGFTSGETGYLVGSTTVGDFVLPADEELWAATVSGTSDFYTLVTVK